MGGKTNALQALAVVGGLLLVTTVTVHAGNFCKADCDGDCKVTLSDLVTMKSEFMSPDCEACSPPYPAPFAKTGQTFCYNEYDDAWMSKGVASPNPRFADNGDGTVKDNLTGLIWLKDACCLDVQAADWWNALNNAYFLHGTCGGTMQGVCGLTDSSCAGEWRLPNVRELQSLIDYGVRVPPEEPALPSGHPFINVCLPAYWTSTTNRNYALYAFNIGMATGIVDYVHKTTAWVFVWPVRGGH